MDKTQDAFRTIGEVAEQLDLPQHVLRFWETKFPQIRPVKRAGGRRYYRPEDIQLVSAIRVLLYGEGYTIRGVQRLLKEQGARALIGAARGGKPLTAGEWPPAPGDLAPALSAGASRSALAIEPASQPSDLFSLAASRRLYAPAPPAMGGGKLAPRDRALLEQALSELEEGARRLGEALAG